ncbi:MAG: alpha/beta hydrolase [Planctomycetes bacterium]|nr:alpha/beta hydrolase [Planctomycetota bacterium]
MLVSLLFALGQAAHSDPPKQPPTGPGGAEYTHEGVARTLFEGPFENGSRASFWLFEPTPPPTDAAPTIAFFHGFGAGDPANYGAWIDHLVRRGKVVVFPLYQSSERGGSDPEGFTSAAIDSLRRALQVLSDGEHVAPDLDRIAFAGHAIGGMVAVEVAARAPKADLPSPKALFAIEPGFTDTGRFGVFPRADLSLIAKGTLLLSLVGDADSIAGDLEASRIYLETTSIPADDKDIVVLHSDDHGRPALNAHHLAPLSIDRRYTARKHDTPLGPREETDALDYFGLWKLFDALCDAGFDGLNREFALGNTPEQRYMGVWSDGWPVAEMGVMDLE